LRTGHNILTPFTESDGSLLCSQEHVTGLYVIPHKKLVLTVKRCLFPTKVQAGGSPPFRHSAPAYSPYLEAVERSFPPSFSLSVHSCRLPHVPSTRWIVTQSHLAATEFEPPLLPAMQEIVYVLLPLFIQKTHSLRLCLIRLTRPLSVGPRHEPHSPLRPLCRATG